MIDLQIKKFMTLAPLLLPELIGDSLASRVVRFDDSAMLTFELERDDWPFDQVVTMLTQDMELVLLYDAVTEGSPSLHHFCAFSAPSSGDMLRVNVVTSPESSVSHLVVTLYSSLELMATELEDDLEIHMSGFVCRESIPLECLLTYFC